MTGAPVNTVLKINVTAAEKRILQEAATRAGQSVSAYVRRVVFDRPQPLPAECLVPDLQRAGQVLDAIRDVADRIDTGDLEGLCGLRKLQRIEQMICPDSAVYIFGDDQL